MAKTTDLMGLGMAHMVANVLGNTPTIATAFGATIASANPIGNYQHLTLCLTGTSSFLLPQVGGDTGCLLGDEFIVANMTTASVKVFINNTAAGSAVTMYGGAASTAGTTGVTLVAGMVGQFNAITVSTWICGITSV